MNAARADRIAVVGGGPAGAITALVLARQGLPTVVLEALDEPADKVGECLPPTVNPLLAHLGLLDALHQDGHLRSHGNRSVWGSPQPIDHDFLSGLDGPGWHLDRSRFEGFLATAARAAGAHWRYGCRLQRCVSRGRGWLLEIRSKSGSSWLTADFVVDATGRSARVARTLGSRRIRDDRLVAATAVMSATSAALACPDSFTLVEATPHGWWYSAALPTGRLAVAFLSDSDLIDRAAVRDPARWAAMLYQTDHTAARIRSGHYQLETQPRLVPAHSGRLIPAAGPKWLAVGDAAAAHDPLSSFGIGSAMGTGYHAAHAIAGVLAGRHNCLDDYTRLVERTYVQYLDRLSDHYHDERRWPDQPFWRRRHQGVPPGAHGSRDQLG